LVQEKKNIHQKKRRQQLPEILALRKLLAERRKEGGRRWRYRKEKNRTWGDRRRG
jgi:hypothetical protein